MRRLFININRVGNLITTNCNGYCLIKNGLFKFLILFILLNCGQQISAQITTDILVVSGGGSGGGFSVGGGGGGGAVKYFTGQSIASGTYVVTVGAGGAANSSGNLGNPGESSAFGTYVATSSSSANGASGTGGGGGGSGGGGGADFFVTYTGGVAVAGMGYNGGASVHNTKYYSGLAGGGGGGAGGAGGNATLNTSNKATAGNGGAGISNSISGTTVFYGGGGGGGCTSNSIAPGAGGIGGGGAGGQCYDGVNGTPNTGGGGGGGGGGGNNCRNIPGGSNGVKVSGAGGSGVVIIRYLGSVAKATGGTITYAGGYVIHTFTASGNFVYNPGVPSISAQPASATQTKCLNSTASALSVTASGTSLTYQWYSNTANSNVGGVLLDGAINNTYTPLTTASGTTYYYVVVTGSLGAVTSDVSGAITVLALPTISSQPSTSTQSVCANAAASVLSVTAAAGSGTISSYQWYKNVSNSNSGGTGLGVVSSSATVNNYTPVTTATGDLYYYTVVTNSNGCSVTSNTSGLVTVKAAPTITINGSSIVTGSAMSFTSTASAGVTYQWKLNGVNQVTTANYTSSAALVSGDIVLCEVTSNGCTKSNSIVMSLEPLSTDILVVGAGGSGGAHFNASVGTGGGGGGGVIHVQGFNLAYSTYTITVAGTTSGNYITHGNNGSASEFKNGDNSLNVTANGGGSGAGNNNGGGGSGGSGGGGHAGGGGGSNTKGSVTGIASTFYTAYGNNGGSGASYAGGGGGGATGTGSNAPNTFDGGNGGAGVSINISGSSQTYGSGGGGSAEGASKSGGSAGTNAGSGGNSGSSGGNAAANRGGGGGGSANTNSTGGSGGSGVVIIRYQSTVALGTGGTITSYTGNGTNGTNGVVYQVHTFTSSGTLVLTRPLINTSITTQPSTTTQSVCQFATPTDVSVVAKGESLTYQWYSNTANSNSGGTLINGATNRNYTPITSAIGTLYYYVVVSGTTGSPSTITSNVSGAVTVSAVPTISIQTPSAGICTGASVTFSSTVSGSPTYQWKKNGTNIPSATSSTYTTTTLVNNDVITCTIVSSGCSANSNAITMAVSDAPSSSAATTTNIELLLVGGGGGGGSFRGGGGGGGGFLSVPTYAMNRGTSVNITVGTGGAGGYNVANQSSVNGAAGGNSSFGAIYTAIGGGGGGSFESSSPNGTTGGSGGGGGTSSCAGKGMGATASGGQGYAGGNATLKTGCNGWEAGGGGGGAGSAGTNASGGTSSGVAAYPGNGGNGVQNNISGTNTWYSGGGGGAGIYSPSQELMGSYGSGGGPTYYGGGGMAGSKLSSTLTGVAGANGIVIIKYAGTPIATGGTIVTAGGYTTHTFTSNGVFAMNSGATFTAASRCGAGVVTLSGVAPGAGLAYDWYNSASAGTLMASGTTSFTTPVISETTTYYVATRNTSSGCNSVSRTPVVATVHKAFTTAALVGPTSICQGASANLQANITGGLSPFSITINDGTSDLIINNYTSGANIAISPTVNTTYTLKNITSVNGCSASLTTDSTVTVTINSVVTPSVTIAAESTTICENDVAIIRATPVNGGSNPTYVWKKNGVVLDASGAVLMDASLKNGDVISCVMTSNAPCLTGSAIATSNSVSMTVNSLSVITVVPASVTISSGGSVNLSATNSVSFLWSPATYLNTTIGANVISTPFASVNYIVTGTNEIGCLNTQMVQVTTGSLVGGSIGSDTVICAGAVTSPLSSVSAASGISAAQMTYQWQMATLFEDWSDISSANATSYDPPNNLTNTTFYRRKVVDNTSGAFAYSNQITITVNENPLAVITNSGAANICSGNSATLTSSAGEAYQWYNGGVAIGGANNITYQAINSGNYTVKVSNAGGCTTTSAVTAITVNPSPVVVTNQTSMLGTTGSTVYISVSASGGSGSNYTYQWKNGSGNIAGQNLLYYNATVSDTYSVLVTDGNACTTTSNPIPVIINASEQYSLCAGDSTIFQFDKSTVSGNPTVTWEYSANNSSWSTLTTGITNITATLQYCTAKIAGYYRVRLDGTSTTYTTVQRVIVNTNPSVNISSNPAAVASLCAGASAIFTANVSAGTPSYTYQWSTGGSAIGSATSSSYISTSNGSFNVFVTDANGCSGTATSATMFINPVPIVSVNSINFCEGQSGTIIATPEIAGSYTYAWTVPSGVTAPGNVASFSVTKAGTYSVVITSVGSACSSVSASGTVTLNSLPELQELTGDTSLCLGTSSTLSSNVTNGVWSSSNPGVATVSQSGVITPVAVGSTVISLLAQNFNGCSSTVSSTVTVSAIPTISSAIATGAQSVCLDGTATALSITATAGSGSISKYKWYSNSSNNNSGGTLVATNNTTATTNTYTPVTSIAGTKYYYCEVTNSNGCAFTSAVSGAITIASLSVGGVATANSFFINYGATTNLSVTGYVGSIQWQQSLDGSTNWVAVTGGSGSTTDNYTTAALTVPTYFRAVTTSGACAIAYSNTILITITSTPIVSTGIVTSVCYSTSAQTTTLAYTSSAGNPTAYSIDWSDAANTAGLSDQGNTAYTFLNGGGNITGIIIPAGLPVGNYTGTMNITNGIGSSAQAITLSVGSVAGIITGANAIAAGTNSTTLTLVGYTGSIQWQSSTNNSTFADIVGETNSTYTVTNLSNTVFYKAIVTNGSCASVTTATATVFVLSASTAFAISGTATPNTMPNNVATVVDPAIIVLSNGTINGFTVSITSDYTDGDILSYTGDLPNGIYASAFNTSTRNLSFFGSTSASAWQALLRTVTLNSTSSCFPTNRKISFLPGTKFFNYFSGHYYEFVANQMTWANAKTNAGSMSYFGRQGYLVNITSEAENNYINTLIGSNSWIGATDNFAQINAAVGYTKYANQSASEGQWHWVTGPEKGTKIRTGNASTAEKPGVAVSGIYQNWNSSSTYASNEPNDVWGNGYPGEEDYGHMYASTGKWNDFPATKKISSIVEYGGMQGDDTASTISFTRNIVITGSPVGTISGGATVCAGTNSTTLTYSGGGTVQRWEYSLDNFATAGFPVANTANTLTVTNLTTSRYYRVVVNTTGCSGLGSSPALINVVQTTAGNISSFSSSICSGGNAILTLNGNSGSILKWQYATNSNFSSGLTDISSTTNTITQPMSSAGTYYFRAQVLNSSCPSGNAVFTDGYPIVVGTGTAPVGGTVNSVAHCGGSNTGTLTLSGSTGTAYQWQVSTDGYGLIWDNADSTSTTFTYSGITTTTRYRVKVTSGSCGDAFSSIGTVTINQAFSAGVISGGGTPVCAGTNSIPLTLNDYIGSIQWEASTDNATFNAIGGAVGATYTPSNLTNTKYFRTVVTNGACASFPSPVAMVPVNPTPSVSVGTLAVINTNLASTLYLPYIGSESLTNYSVIPSSTNPLPSFTPVSNGVVTSSPLQLALPNTAAAGTYNFYLLVKNANGCISDTNNLVLAIKPKIITESGQTTNINSKAVNQYGAKSVGIGRTPNGKLIAIPTLLQITTTTITGITSTAAISGGLIKIDGGSAITARGICWNTTGNPTTFNNKTVVAGTTGTFSSNLIGLTAGTTYYVRAYATNSLGTVYGAVQTFTTSP